MNWYAIKLFITRSSGQILPKILLCIASMPCQILIISTEEVIVEEAGHITCKLAQKTNILVFLYPSWTICYLNR